MFRKVCVFDVSQVILASHDSDPYPNRSRIARYNATKSKALLETGPI